MKLLLTFVFGFFVYTATNDWIDTFVIDALVIVYGCMRYAEGKAAR